MLRAALFLLLLSLGGCSAAQFDAVAGGIADGLAAPPSSAWPSLGLGPDPTMPSPMPMLLRDDPMPMSGQCFAAGDPS